MSFWQRPELQDPDAVYEKGNVIPLNTKDKWRHWYARLDVQKISGYSLARAALLSCTYVQTMETAWTLASPEKHTTICMDKHLKK